MRILFVYPNVSKQKSPQLGISMIAAVACQLGHEIDLYDLTIIPNGKEISAFKSKLELFQPDILAVSCRTNEWSFINKLFQSANLDRILKIFGGPHATTLPKEVLSIADIAVIGEGENTFLEILKRISAQEDIKNIAGCWVKDNGKIIENEMRDLILDINQLPFPYWKIFDDIHYRNSFINSFNKNIKVVGSFEGSRGCPYNCSYCTNDYLKKLHVNKGKWRREKSPERIIQEIELFRDEYGLDYLYWIDEILLTDIERLKRFRDLYTSKVKVPFIFMERPENMNDEKVSIIKEAGAQRVSIGIESGDENIRKNLLNRYYSQETVISAFQTAKRHNLITHAFTMIGFPGEDLNSLKETRKLLMRARPDTVQTTIFFPLPRTELYDKVVKEGLFDPESAMPDTYYEKSCLNFSESKKTELLKWQYILTYYNSRIMGLFMLILPAKLMFFLRNIYIKFKKKGLLYALTGFDYPTD